MTSLPTIIRAAVKRFIPGVLIFLGGAWLLTAIVHGDSVGLAQIQRLFTLTLLLAGGFVTALSVVRRWLHPSAGVEGRRGVLAGFAATCVLLGLGVLHGSPTPPALSNAFAFVAGSVTTIVLFAPWTSVRPSGIEAAQA